MIVTGLRIIGTIGFIAVALLVYIGMTAENPWVLPSSRVVIVDETPQPPYQNLEILNASATPQAVPRVSKNTHVEDTVSPVTSVPQSHTPTTTPKITVPPGIAAIQQKSDVLTGGTDPAPPAQFFAEELFPAIVKIECPTSSGVGAYTGTGFVVPPAMVITAAHIVINVATTTCRIIFPQGRTPTYHVTGTIEQVDETRRRHDEEGLDIALLRLPPEEERTPESLFSNGYPEIPYPLCGKSSKVGDRLRHFGYPTNFAGQNYLLDAEGELILGANITGMTTQLSEDQRTSFRTPLLSFKEDAGITHPYLVSHSNTFYGDSGGLVFNETRRCVLGIQRASTLGRKGNDNFALFFQLGWEEGKQILSSLRFGDKK